MSTGINTTGIHDPTEYLIGRAIVKFAELDASGFPKEYRDVGNVSELTSTVESETYDHFSSREGIKERDLRIVLQQDVTLGMTLENINFQNLAIFFSGDASLYTNPGIAGFSTVRFVNDDEVTVNSWYSIVDASHNPVFGITSTNSIVVESTNGTPIALVLDTDYSVNDISGQIFLEDTVTTQAVITAGDGLQCTLTADAAATKVDQVNVLSSSELNLAVRIESLDAETGKYTIYEIHKATVSSDGDFNLISDEAAQLPISLGVESSAAYSDPVDIYYPNTQA
jgi:hypothetical protein